MSELYYWMVSASFCSDLIKTILLPIVYAADLRFRLRFGTNAASTNSNKSNSTAGAVTLEANQREQLSKTICNLDLENI